MLTPQQTKDRLDKINQIKINRKIKDDEEFKEKAEKSAKEAVAILLLAALSLSMTKKKKKWYQF